MPAQGNRPKHGKSPTVAARDHQPDLREEQTGLSGMTERPIVVRKPGNAALSEGALVPDRVQEAATAEEIGS